MLALIGVLTIATLLFFIMTKALLNKSNFQGIAGSKHYHRSR